MSLDKTAYIFHLFVLAIILTGGVWMFFMVQGDSFLQFSIGVITTLFYIAWGMLHHWVQHDLYPRVVVEYLVIGVIAIGLLSLILR